MAGKKGNFSMIENELWDCSEELGIGPYEIAAYGCLIRHRNGDRMCWPSYATIARKCGISRAKAITTVQRLRDKGLVGVFTRSEGAHQLSNSYFIVDVKDVLTRLRAAADSEKLEVDAAEVSPQKKRGVVHSVDYPVHSVDPNKTKLTKIKDPSLIENRERANSQSTIDPVVDHELAKKQIRKLTALVKVSPGPGFFSGDPDHPGPYP